MDLPRIAREHLGHEPMERPVLSPSMWPMIRQGDRIRFRRSSRRPRLGEVWVAARGPIHVVHRVLWTRADAVLFKGDSLASADGWVAREELVGPVEAIDRGAGWKATNRLGDRVLGLGLSMALWPYRWLGERTGFSLRVFRAPAT